MTWLRNWATVFFIASLSAPAASSLELQLGLRTALAFGRDDPLATGAISCRLADDPVSARAEVGLGATAGQLVWVGGLALGVDLAVPWRPQPSLEIGLGSAGDGDTVSLYPVIGLGLTAQQSQWLLSLQARYRSQPIPLPFQPAADYPVRPLEIVVGLDRIIGR